MACASSAPGNAGASPVNSGSEAVGLTMDLVLWASR